MCSLTLTVVNSGLKKFEPVDSENQDVKLVRLQRQIFE